jgi:hypothetical protein
MPLIVSASQRCSMVVTVWVVVHALWGGRVGGDGQGAAPGRAAIGAWRGGFDALLTNQYLKLCTTRSALT